MEGLTGKTISHYRILNRLGAGGMGVVYKAEDTKLKRTVTLKFLTLQALRSEEEKIRFISEAQGVSRLDHPNIAKIYEIGEAEGECFICMAYLEGKSLKEIIKDRTISIRALLEIAIKIGEGLTAAHKKEIIHGNIKSDNVMLTKEGGIKITDFGLPTLKKDSVLTKTETALGTVQYMSPEQARGAPLDRRTDIFSFGVVLYEMITGQLPFKGKDEAAIIHSITNEDPEPLAKHKREVPEQLQKIVDKLLQKDTKLRSQTMDEVLTDLKRLKQKLILKRPLVFRKVRPRYKKALIAALIICFIIAVILLVILSKYLLKPILEKKGSIPPNRPIEVMCFREEKTKYFFESPSQRLVADFDKLGKFEDSFSKSVRLDNDVMDRESGQRLKRPEGRQSGRI
jgi:serine/threonine protein kinase